MKKKQTNRKQVLTDHEKRGKRLIPPLIAASGPLSHVPWINHIVPEVIWIGLLHQALGEAEGTEVALELARICEKHATQRPVPLFVGISDYRSLGAEEQTKVVSELQIAGRLTKLQRAIFPLIQFYPTCPMKFLFTEPQNHDPKSELATLKLVLGEMFDKRLRRSVMIQATVVYIGFVLGRLKVRAGLTLSHFPEIEKYPSTELSRRVASGAFLAAMNFFGEFVETATWPVEFWNQGQWIEPCTL